MNASNNSLFTHFEQGRANKKTEHQDDARFFPQNENLYLIDIVQRRKIGCFQVRINIRDII
jgi:hypothetical protein